MGDPRDVERRAPVTVTVLTQVEIVADAMQPDRQQADAVPVVEPSMDQGQLGRLSLDKHGGERGPQAANGGGQFHQPSRVSRLCIVSARANTVLAVGHVALSRVVVGSI
jgi:hypothetical protein